jgi:hypothetical protein
MATNVTTKSLDSSVCPGSGMFPDVVNDLVLDELSYVCATCGASVPNSKLHRSTDTASVDPGSLPRRTGTTEVDKRCFIEK